MTTNIENMRARIEKIKMLKKLFNKETGFPIAKDAEELPPLRKGYVRLVHQTHAECAVSLAENGLVYNRIYAGRTDCGSRYAEITSMAVAKTEDEFWQSLTKENVRHKGADVMAIFDMPQEECGAHQRELLAQYLNGTISRGYLVGVIPNYGNQDIKLTQEEMEIKRASAQQNPLPPAYETPNWRENVQQAQDKMFAQLAERENEDEFGGNFSAQEQDNLQEEQNIGQIAEATWDDFDDWETVQDVEEKATTSAHLFEDGNFMALSAGKKGKCR